MVDIFFPCFEFILDMFILNGDEYYLLGILPSKKVVVIPTSFPRGLILDILIVTDDIFPSVCGLLPSNW